MKTTTSSSVDTARSPSNEEISRRAYELWLQDGCPHGRHIEHWLEAEYQLRGLNTAQSEWHTEARSIEPSPSQRIPAREDVPTFGATIEDARLPAVPFEDDAPLAAKVARQVTEQGRTPVQPSVTSANVS